MEEVKLKMRGKGRPKKIFKNVTSALDVVYDGAEVHDGKVPDEPVELQDYETKLYLESRTQEIDRALVMACKEGNAQALKIAYMLQGKIKEDEKSQKVKVSINGTDLAKELLRARRELDKTRMVEVQPESGILHQPVRQITGQG